MALLYVNSVHGTIIRQVQTPSVITHLQLSHSMLLSGSSDGYLRIHDTRKTVDKTANAESVVRAHSGGIQGLQTTGNFAFTIGLGVRFVHSSILSSVT